MSLRSYLSPLVLYVLSHFVAKILYPMVQQVRHTAVLLARLGGCLLSNMCLCLKVGA
jgi:hypothetical protein